SWIPKLGTVRSRCRAAANETGDRSPAPWEPVRTPYRSARSKILRRGVMPPACDTEVRIPEDVPQGAVHHGDGGHCLRPAPRVGALVRVLPGVVDPARVPAHEQRADVIPPVGGHREFTPVQCRGTDTGEAVLG